MIPKWLVAFRSKAGSFEFCGLVEGTKWNGKPERPPIGLRHSKKGVSLS